MTIGTAIDYFLITEGPPLSQYKTLEFAGQGGTTITKPELIGASEIFMIIGMGGPWDTIYLTQSGATLDPATGTLIIPGFDFWKDRQFIIRYR